MKKIILLSTLSLFMLGANAQKIKQTEGKLSFLQDQKELSVEFLYADDLKVGKYTEQEYIEKKTAKADDKESGSGAKWLESWKNDRPNYYQPKFIELFNDVMQKKGVSLSEGNVSANYLFIIETIFIEPGYNVGVSRKNAYINLVVSIVENNNRDNILAKFTIDKSPGKMALGSDFDTGMRIGEAYAKAAKVFASYLLKNKAF